MENNDDSASAKNVYEKNRKKAIDECKDMKLLDLVYRILVFDKTEGRADQPCLLLCKTSSFAIKKFFRYLFFHSNDKSIHIIARNCVNRIFRNGNTCGIA